MLYKVGNGPTVYPFCAKYTPMFMGIVANQPGRKFTARGGMSALDGVKPNSTTVPSDPHRSYVGARHSAALGSSSFLRMHLL